MLRLSISSDADRSEGRRVQILQWGGRLISKSMGNSSGRPIIPAGGPLPEDDEMMRTSSWMASPLWGSRTRPVPMVNWSSSACGSRNDWCQEAHSTFQSRASGCISMPVSFSIRVGSSFSEKLAGYVTAAHRRESKPGTVGPLRWTSLKRSPEQCLGEIPAAFVWISGENCPAAWKCLPGGYFV